MVRFISAISLVLFASASYAGSTIKVQSKQDVAVTESRFLEVLKKAEVPVQSASEFEKKLPGGFALKGKEIKFTNPYYGWNLGECHRGERKDKPLTARIWRDNQQRVWLEYTAPEDFVNQFGVIECGNEMDKVRNTLDGFADAATE